jgi:hypothetical protein
METSSFASLETLSDIGLRGGIDMRPTLLRVLTDLYVQKPTHPPDEERYYTELALRLLDSVDVQTRSAVAARLARHLSPPRPVIARLAADLPEVAAALRVKVSAPPDGASNAARRDLAAKTNTHTSATYPSIVPASTFQASTGQSATAHVSTAHVGRKPAQSEISVEAARELNELFFTANAIERRLILLNLDIVVGAPAGRAADVSDAEVGRKLEAAALARKREDFAGELARALRISREQARRMAADELGEPIVVAAKALGVPRDLLYRILLFVNTAVGHSVERVHTLATLYDEMNAQAAWDLVAIWRALNINKEVRAAGVQRPYPVNERPLIRPAASVARAPAPPQKIARRDAS